MGAATSGHPTRETLISFGLGKLDDASAASVSKHLEGCPDCSRHVAEVSTDSFLDRVRDAKSPTAAAAMTDQSRTTGASFSQFVPQSAAPPPSHTLPPGLADHPDYQVKKELGRGGMGVVYLAHNTLMGRDEVLKVMSRQIMERPGALDRFLREIRAVAKLRHANIVTAYSALRIGESIVFAMEYVDGLDLSRVVKAKGPLPVGHACLFAHQAALGLQHAHEEGLVHRDIKPSNLMLSRKGDKATIKVLDFGLSKATREENVDGGLTSVGQALGTPDYIAPEQIIDAQTADIRADIYSLGATLYCLLSGRPPFMATSLYDMYQAHISRDADPLNLMRPEVPVELAALVAKMMAKEPERRFQTPGAAAEALTRFFKKPSAYPDASSANVLHTGPLASQAESSLAGPPQPQLATAAGSSAAPIAKSSESAEGVAWESMFEIVEEERPVGSPKQKRGTSKSSPSQGSVRRPPWMRPAVAAAMLGVLALGVVIYVATDHGSIKIVVDGPQPSVTIDRETVRVDGLGETITLRAGKHDLTVKWGDGEFKTQEFDVHRGNYKVLHVEYPTKESSGDDGDSKTHPSAITNDNEPSKGPSEEPSGKPGASQTVKALGRESIDKMLVVTTNDGNIIENAKRHFSDQIGPNAKAVFRDGKVFINEAFGRKNVLCTEPRSPSSPAILDFSSITKDRTGLLTVAVHGYPVVLLGGRLVVKSDNVEIEQSTVDYRDDWKTIKIPFRQNEIRLEHHAMKGKYEFFFYDYQVVLDPAPEALTERVDAKGAAPSDKTAKELNGKAWELATAAEAKDRDGAKAVELATRACALDGHKTATYLDTLAAAYAEVGDFAQAVKWQTRAIELNRLNTDINDFQARLGLYTRKKPYHQGGDPSQSDSSANRPGTAGADAVQNGFVSLFNGKDLTGWKAHPSQPGNWRVENGILIGSGPGNSHMYTRRGDYENFHLRVEARVNDGGNSGIYFRSPFGPTFPANNRQWLAAYNAKIDKNRFGGLIVDGDVGRPLIRNQIPNFRPGEWITLEVIVQDNHIEFMIDGVKTADYTDLERHFGRGHIALQQHGPQTVAEFRRIEIKESRRGESVGKQRAPGGLRPQPSKAVVKRKLEELRRDAIAGMLHHVEVFGDEYAKISGRGLAYWNCYHEFRPRLQRLVATMELGTIPLDEFQTLSVEMKNRNVFLNMMSGCEPPLAEGKAPMAWKDYAPAVRDLDYVAKQFKQLNQMDAQEVDSFRTGSLWTSEGEQLPRTVLLVVERFGDQFKGTFVSSDEPLLLLQIKGNIRDGQISWLGKDAVAKQPVLAPDQSGSLSGESIKMKWSGNGGSGRYVLRLVKNKKQS